MTDITTGYDIVSDILSQPLPKKERKLPVIDITAGYDIYCQLPEEVTSLWTEHFPGAFLAGGAIRSYFDGTEVNDYDFYFIDRGDIYRTADKLKGYLPKVETTDENSSYLVADIETFEERRIQFIHAVSNSLEGTIANFDITAVRMALDSSGCLYTCPGAIDDAKNKLLKITNYHTYVNKNPITVILRMLKYLRRGYTPQVCYITAVAHGTLLTGHACTRIRETVNSVIPAIEQGSINSERDLIAFLSDLLNNQSDEVVGF